MASLKTLAVLVTLLLIAIPPNHAEDLKLRWYVGGNLSFLSTSDDIRSNAGLFLGRFGDDGLPGTGDPNESLDCQESGVFCDPRPDHQLGRENSIEETFKYDLTLGYGMTSWLSLQLDASYFRGDVGPLDLFVSEAFPLGSGSGFVVGLSEETYSATAGELTEIPVSLTAVIRLGKDRSINPYFGVGGGVILARLDRSPDVGVINERLADFRIRSKTDEFGVSLLSASESILTSTGRVPLGRHFITVDVDDGFEWHLMGGAEYFFRDRFSVVFDARYTFAHQGVTILLGGEDQVDYTIFAEHLFRADNSLKYFNHLGVPPNPPGLRCDPSMPAPGGDLDGDGRRPGDPDICYNYAIFGSNALGANEPTGKAVVQGGLIDLTGFSVAIGLRYTF